MILQIHSRAGHRRVNYRRARRRSGHSIRRMKEAVSLAEDWTKVEDCTMAVDCCLFLVMNLRPGSRCSVRCFRDCLCRDARCPLADCNARREGSMLIAGDTDRIADRCPASCCAQTNL